MQVTTWSRVLLES